MKNTFTLVARPQLPKSPKKRGWHNLGLFILVSLSLTNLATAQDIIWDKTIGGSALETISAVKATNDGGYIVGGTSSSPISGDKTQANRGNGNSDYWIVKYQANGSKAWDRAFGGGGHDQLNVLLQTQDGGFILGGTTTSIISGDKTEKSRGRQDYWIVKVDAQGNKQWDRTYGGHRDDKLASIIQTSDGGYLVGGSSDSRDTGDKSSPQLGFGNDYWLLKLNEAGGKVWDKSYGGSYGDNLKSIIPTQDGNFMLAGESSSEISGNKTVATKGDFDFWMIKIKPDGTKIWEKSYGGEYRDIFVTLQPTQDGGYILGGRSNSEISGDKSEAIRGDIYNDDYWVIKIKADGTKVWDKTVGGFQDDLLSAVQPTQDGGYILGGTSNSGVNGEKSQLNTGTENATDYWLVKLSATGKFISDKTLGGSNNDYLAIIQPTPDGNYWLGGTSGSTKSGDKSQTTRGGADFWVVKVNDKFKKNQLITFEPIQNQVVGDAAATLVAKSTSGLPVSFEVLAGPATITGNKLSVFGIGQVRISAYQKGNNDYNPIEKTQIITATLSGKKAEWTYGGNKADTLAAIVATPDGGYLIGGTSASGISGDKSQNSQGNTDFWVAKINKSGQKVWDKTYGGQAADKLTSLVATLDGGYLLGGSSGSGQTGDKSQASNGKSDYWVVKIDNEGNKLWDKTYGGTNNDYLSAVLVTNNGYLLGGSSASATSPDKSQASKGQTDYWVLQIDENGTKLWDKTFGGNQDDQLAALLASPEGGFLVGGSSASSKSGDKSQASRALVDYWVIRISEQGTKFWDKTYGGIKGSYTSESVEVIYGKSYLRALTTTPDGGYLIGGSSTANTGAEKSSSSNGLADYWVLKITGQGEKVWDSSFGGIVSDSQLSLITTSTPGSYLLAGTSAAYKGRDKSEENRRPYELSYYFEKEFQYRNDYWLVRINEQGKKLDDRTIGGTQSDNLAAVVKTATGNFLLAGYSDSNKGADKKVDGKGATDFWLVEVAPNKIPEPTASAWDMRFGGEKNDHLTDVIRTRDGGYLSVGFTDNTSTGDKTQHTEGKMDYWIVKTDKSGQKIWDKAYGGTEDDYLNRVIQTQDGGYLLAGTSLSGISGSKTQAGRGQQDYWIVKVDSLGNKQWNKRYGGSGYDDLRKVVQLATGEYILGGNSNSPLGGNKTQSSHGGMDYWLVKISINGAKIWDKRYGGSANETLGSFAVTDKGGFLLAGSSLSGKSGDKTEPNKGSSDYWVVSADKDGNLLWDKSYGGNGQDQVYSVSRRGSNLYLAGTSSSGKSGDKSQTNKGGKDYWVVKIDGAGNKIWDQSFGGSDDDELRASTFTKQGLYVLAGTSFSEISGDKTQGSRGGSDYWAIAVNEAGTKVYDQRFGGSGNEELRTVLQTQDGGFLLGGMSDSGISGERSQPNWGNAYFSSLGTTDFWLVKVAPITASLAATQLTGLAGESVTVTPTVLAYPNPFQDKLTINFTLPETQVATLRILDSQGREVTKLFQQEAKANRTYQVEWQASKQEAGMYLLQLQTPTKQNTQKLLLSK